ncbi:hypothetical protein GGR51DRAFT_157051 [Nemania sp. FL0031]|nr:hypothetical protein GGR51DRAFT_157051 [Nemania sp. FL0031]
MKILILELSLIVVGRTTVRSRGSHTLTNKLCITPVSDHQFSKDNHSACDLGRYMTTGMETAYWPLCSHNISPYYPPRWAH